MTKFVKTTIHGGGGAGRNFSYIRNEFLQDPDLSFGAKGLGVILLSFAGLPVDTDCLGEDPKDAIAELIEHGYLREEDGALVMYDRKTDD